ncbi:MAG: hypothetical protein HKO71_03875 [Pseudomonadales bacterium]|nr:hypothetical protein [Pseudomonadales bacterium]
MASEVRRPAAGNGAVQLAALLDGAKAMRAEFNHAMRDASGALLDESSGWMAWQRPGNFRWEVLQPLAQTLLINGDVFYQYDRDLEQLIVAPVSPQVSALPNVLLAGDVAAINQQYEVEAIYAVATDAGEDAKPVQAGQLAGQARLFKLTPRHSDGLFTAIVVEFAQSQIAAIDIEDDLQQTSRFEFSASSPLDKNTDALFAIDPAPGTEIIHQ